MPYALVSGEEELGVQKQCRRCGSWWPAMDPEFWQPTMKRGHPTFHSWCRACLAEDRATRRRRERAFGVG